MTISLIVLAYNEKNFIKRVVEKYNKKFHEIIIVNDSSTDGTTEILKDLSISINNLYLI